MIDPSNMQVAGLQAFLAPVLAQEQVAVGAQLEYFQSVVLSPGGITALLLGIVFIGITYSIPQRLAILTGATMFMLTMMLHEATASRNVLVGPLQLVRNISRPIAFALIGFAAVSVLFTKRGDRGRIVGVTSMLFLAFQLSYALQYAAFIETLKGLLSMGSMVAMFIVCTIGLGRQMQDGPSARKALEIFLWVSAAFVATNVTQLVLGPSAAVISGRLAGIAGNAQQLGGVCALMLLVNAYLFSATPVGSWKRWLALVIVAFLALFIIWSGSRTSALTVATGLVFMYRLQLGRFAVLALGAGVALLVAGLLFEDSTSNVSRFVEGGNTRAYVFSAALDDFFASPTLGMMRTGIESGVESTYLRALASMGMIGGIAALLPFSSMGIGVLRALYMDVEADTEIARLRDFFVGTTMALFVINAFEGFAFGVLTFPAMFMYSVFAVGAFLLDPQRSGAGGRQEDLAAGMQAQAGAG